MAVINLTNSPERVVQSLSLDMSQITQCEYTLASTLVSGTPDAIDDIVLFKASGVIKWKGLVRATKYALGQENISVTAYGAEFVLEGQPWTPTNQYYNQEGADGKRVYDTTIADLINFEYANNSSGPKTWFTSLEVPASIQSLVIAAVSTYQKSFMSVLTQALSIYPFIQWSVVYDPTATTVFPIGKLQLIDTRSGLQERPLTVGGLTGTVADFNLSLDGTETAKNVLVYGRGEFKERLEILTPDWDPLEEKLDARIPHSGTNTWPGSVDTKVFITVPKEFDLLSVYPKLFMDGTAVYPFTEYTVDISTGEVKIVTNNSVSWIDQDTGTVANSGGGGPPALPGNWRRFIGANNGHLNKSYYITYSYMGADCYRRYRTLYPIANLKLKKTKVPDEKNPGNTLDRAIISPDPVMEVFTPAVYFMSSESFLVADPPHLIKMVEYTGPVYPLPPVVRRPPNNLQGGGTMLYGSDDKNLFVQPIPSPSFREGTTQVTFEQRIISVSTLWTGGNPSQGANLSEACSFKLAIQYTSWENISSTGTGSKGDFVYQRAVLDSVMKYTDINGEVITDNSAKLTTAKNSMLEYYGAPFWTGTLAVVTSYTPETDTWQLPYAVGDKVTFTGDLTGTPAGFTGIINSIDLSSIENGVISLGIGRRAPQKNPFLPPPPNVVSLEYGNDTSQDISGLSTI